MANWRIMQMAVIAMVLGVVSNVWADGEVGNGQGAGVISDQIPLNQAMAADPAGLHVEQLAAVFAQQGQQPQSQRGPYQIIHNPVTKPPLTPTPPPIGVDSTPGGMGPPGTPSLYNGYKGDVNTDIGHGVV